jgi:hypothetical protein
MGTLRYMAPELQDVESAESDDADSFITKKTDVYAFSMFGVEVSLFQMVHILVFQGHYHRFYLDDNLTPIYVAIIRSSCEFRRVYDQVGKNVNCPDCMQRYGTFLSVAGFIILQTGLRCQSLYSNYPIRDEVFYRCSVCIVVSDNRFVVLNIRVLFRPSREVLIWR